MVTMFMISLRSKVYILVRNASGSFRIAVYLRLKYLFRAVVMLLYIRKKVA
jgi:hypothetical protein